MPDRLSLPRFGVDALEFLYQHRLLSTPQLREMLEPPMAERSVVRILDQLQAQELVASTRGRSPMGRGPRLWFLTQHGAELIEVIPNRAETRRRLLTLDKATSQLQAHTIGVNDVGIAFLRAARERGHDFGAYSWRHEVAYGLRPRDRGTRALLIADAVLCYWMTRPDGRPAVRYRFVELDRANRLVEDVAGKLARYARLRQVWAEQRTPGHHPAEEEVPWGLLYRHLGVIVVLDNPNRANLQRRLASLIALCRTDPNPDADGADGVSVSFVLFDDLKRYGPFAPIFRRLEDDRRVNWLGEEDAQDRASGRRIAAGE